MVRIKNWTLLYGITYILFYLGMYGYYRKVNIIGKRNIPKGKPLIFSSNHQNSLVDPCVIAVTSGGKPVHFLTRSDVFNNKKVAKILYALNMLPIYRKQDGPDFKERNKSIFDKCFDILKSKSRIIIFPEGSHDKRKHLRELKGGVGKIGFEAMEKYQELDVYIVPVGLNYTNTINKASELLVNYGRPIQLISYLKQENPSHELMKDLEIGMREVMIDFTYPDYYSIYQFALYDSQRIKTKNLKKKFVERKERIKEIDNWIRNTTEEEKEKVVSDIESINDYCKKEKIKPYLFNKNNYSLIPNFILLAISFPIFIYGWFNNELPYRMPRRVNKLLKDEQFHSSIYLVVGAFLAALFWSIQTLLFYLFISKMYWWCYLISLPITGFLGFNYYIFYKKTIGKLRFNRLENIQSPEFLKSREIYIELNKTI